MVSVPTLSHGTQKSVGILNRSSSFSSAQQLVTRRYITIRIGISVRMQANMLQDAGLHGRARPFTDATKKCSLFSGAPQVFYPATRRRNGEANKRSDTAIGFLPSFLSAPVLEQKTVLEPDVLPVAAPEADQEEVSLNNQQSMLLAGLAITDTRLYTDTLLPTTLPETPQVAIPHQLEELRALAEVYDLQAQLMREDINQAEITHSLLELDIQERVHHREVAQQEQLWKVVSCLGPALSVSQRVTRENHLNHFAEEVFVCGRQHEEDTMRECMDFRVAAMAQIHGFSTQLTCMVGTVMGLMVKSQAAV